MSYKFKVGDKVKLNIKYLRKDYGKDNFMEFIDWVETYKDKIFVILNIGTPNGDYNIRLNGTYYHFFKEELKPAIPYRRIIKSILK